MRTSPDSSGDRETGKLIRGGAGSREGVRALLGDRRPRGRAEGEVSASMVDSSRSLSASCIRVLRRSRSSKLRNRWRRPNSSVQSALARGRGSARGGASGHQPCAPAAMAADHARCLHVLYGFVVKSSNIHLLPESADVSQRQVQGKRTCRCKESAHACARKAHMKERYNVVIHAGNCLA